MKFFPLAFPGNKLLFLILLLLSSVTSVFKVNLPLARRSSTMSVSYAVDFASLLLLGPNETMIVAAASAFSQCTFRIKERNPIHRTLFSMACLVVTVQAAGCGLPVAWRPSRNDRQLASMAQAARRRRHDVFPFQHARPSRRRSLCRRASRCSRSGTRTSCGARRAISSAPARRRWRRWICEYYGPVGGAARAVAPLSSPIAPTRSISAAIDDERRHAQEMADLHLATIEALALAIDAKDQTSQSHIRRVQLYATGARARRSG